MALQLLVLVDEKKSAVRRNDLIMKGLRPASWLEELHERKCSKE
jgi:hypothetical protein